MLSIQLPKEIEHRLNMLAEQAGCTTSSYVREMIFEHLENVEDVRVALERLKNPGKRWTLEEVEASVRGEV